MAFLLDLSQHLKPSSRGLVLPLWRLDVFNSSIPQRHNALTLVFTFKIKIHLLKVKFLTKG
jgi:hypothetical protein